MTIAERLLAVILTSVFMRMKGGGIIDEKKLVWLSARSASAICMSCLVFCITGNPVQALAVGIAWHFGNAADVSDYIQILGGIRGKLNNTGFGTCQPITGTLNFVMERFRINLTTRNIRLVYGLGGCILRGLLLGIPMGIAMVSIAPIAFGALMPLAYFAGVSLRQSQLKTRTIDGWHYGEWIWGAFMGMGVRNGQSGF